MPSAQTPTTDIGHVIGGVFGLVFVVANSGSLAVPARATTIALASFAFAFVVIAFIRSSRRASRSTRRQDERFDKRYLLIVIIEVVALFGGLALLRPIEPAVTLGWIALVVGAHFFPFAALWPRGGAQFRIIGAALALLGALGLLLAFTTHDRDLVALVSGVGSGIALLGLGVVSGGWSTVTSSR